MSNLLIAANLGIMAFFSVAVAPVIFKVLPPAFAGVYVRAFFPRYYAFLALTSVIAFALAESMIARAALVVCAVLFLVSLFVLTPRINEARDAGHGKAFGVLHGLSVAINLMQLAIFGGLLWTTT